MEKGFKKKLALCLIIIMIATITDWGNLFSVEAKAATTPATVSIHDPAITKGNDGKYYLYGTHFGAAVSSDLVNWSNVSLTGITTANCTTQLSEPFKWLNSSTKDYANIWAPSVIYNSTMKKYCYYACMSVFGTTNSVIYFATSDSPTGPFVYNSSIIYSGFTSSTSGNLSYKNTNLNSLISAGTVSGFKSSWATSTSYTCSVGTNPNAIDPTVFYDKDGKLWMVYGSFSGGIFILELNKSTGKPIYPGVDDTANNVDRYFGKMLLNSKNTGDSKSNGNGEGPYITYDSTSGYYYLFNTYGGLSATDGYNIRMYRSKNPNGPYVDASGTSGLSTGNKGVKLFGNYKFACNSQAYLSGGHSSALVDSNGKMFQVYHTRFDDGVGNGHYVRVHQMVRNEDGWPCTAPYIYQGETVSSSGYSSADMVGTYEFINHGNTTLTASSMSTISTAVAPTLSVTLNSNGTVTGGVTGTWSYTSGKPYVKMVIGGVTYKGVFLKQYNEAPNPKEVMTFTLIGTNNCTIWGSKGTGAATANVTEGIYYIKNVNSGLYMDVANGTNANGTAIQQWAYNGYDAQKFKLVPDGKGYYYILTGASNYTRSIDINGGSANDGAEAVQWEYWGGDMQKYIITQNADGSVSFLTKASGANAALEVYANSTANGAKVDQWSYWSGPTQCWKLEKVKDQYEGIYYIQNVNSGYYLDIDSGSSTNGANIRQWYSGSEI
ncbi:RICIN domain-containing protein [Anaerosporobacter sp.]|uniref:RICIN domain-containing protein n=1 Tax=Anaerosporobacter sp. TaxID=1872529 RepID=UPI00286F944E|nr:RICIN domain-containing protein [Anaerosporobacter sp.]